MSIAKQRRSAVNTKLTVMTAAGNYTITDETTLIVNKTVGGATQVTLPATPSRGREVTVSDGKGDAATNNITVVPAAGTINGAASLVISENYGTAKFRYNGTEWNITSQVNPVSAAELAFLNGVVAGTVTASKAVVVDANKDIGAFRNVTLESIVMTGASDIDVAANTAAALEIDDGTTKIVAVDTRNTLKDVASVTITGVPVTVASEAAAHINASLRLANKTITYTGTTGTTSSMGAMLHIGQPTFTDASMMTLTSASTLHVSTVANPGGMLAITNRYMISTGVSDCFLTNAGVWTDTASCQSGKQEIADAGAQDIAGLIDQIRPRTWKYRPDVHGDDHDRLRVGIVSDELPESFRPPGHDSVGVSAGVLSSFALAAIKYLADANRALQARIDRLELAGG
jgi:hypothetical protein